MLEERPRGIIIVGNENIGKHMVDAISDHDELYDIKTTSTGTSIEDLVMMKNKETEQLIKELNLTIDERVATNSSLLPLSGQESRRERRKLQRKYGI